jgi:hypothetical protein
MCHVAKNDLSREKWGKTEINFSFKHEGRPVGLLSVLIGLVVASVRKLIP